jgi:hypothetical protein
MSIRDFRPDTAAFRLGQKIAANFERKPPKFSVLIIRITAQQLGSDFMEARPACCIFMALIG